MRISGAPRPNRDLLQPSRMARHAWRDARDQLGRDVFVALVISLVALLLTGLLTGDWGIAAIVGLVPATIVFVALFVIHFVLNAFRHRRWEPIVTVNLEPEIPQILFEMRSRVGGQPIGRHRCEVTNPEGNTYVAEGLAHDRVDSVWMSYRESDFPGAPAPTSGRYVVKWLEELKHDWREIVRYSGHVSLDK